MIEKISWFKTQSIYRYVRQQAEKNKFFKYIEISATFLLITLFLTTAIAPTASAISKLLGEIKSKELTSQSMKQKITNVVIAQDYYAQGQEQFQLLESSYPSRPRFYQAASNFSSLSSQSGLSINQFKYDISNSNKDDILSYHINLSLHGLYPEFLNMINYIAQGRRLVDIESLTLSQDKEKGFNLNISTKLVYLPSILNNEK